MDVPPNKHGIRQTKMDSQTLQVELCMFILAQISELRLQAPSGQKIQYRVRSRRRTTQVMGRLKPFASTRNPCALSCKPIVIAPKLETADNWFATVAEAGHPIAFDCDKRTAFTTSSTVDLEERYASGASASVMQNIYILEPSFRSSLN